MHSKAPLAEQDLDDIAYYVATQSGSIAVADRLIADITDRFDLLAEYPLLGRDRSHDLGGRRRSYSVGEYIIVYRVEDEDVHILRVVHGKRDLEALFD